MKDASTLSWGGLAAPFLAIVLASACGTSGSPAPGHDGAGGEVDSSASGGVDGSSGSSGDGPGGSSRASIDGGASASSGSTDSASGGGSGSGSSSGASRDSGSSTPPTDSGGNANAGEAGVIALDGGPTSCGSPATDPYSMSIAGSWNFTPTGGVATKIQVPGGGWVKQGFSAASATYQTTITIPNSGAPQTTLLEFGAINHQATLSVDAAVVGTNTTSFTPSVFDVTKYVKPGTPHVISLLVKGRNALKNSAGKDIVPAAADWSPNVAQGIFRSAIVRVYPDVYVSDAFVRTSVTNDSLAYDVWITNSGSASRQLTLSGSLDSWNCESFVYPAIAPTSVTVAAGATQQVTVGPIPWGLGMTSYWWPNVPFQDGYAAKLHNLSVSISEGANVLHRRLVRFGFRETEQRQADAQHAYYYLNGIRVNFRGDSLQGADYDSVDNGAGKGDAYDTLPGFLPPSAQNPGWPQALRNYGRLNYNIIRIHQELAAPYMLDVADEQGQMIIDETAIRGTDGEDFVTGHDYMVNHARALVLRDRNHPSVVRWSQSNEENLSSTDSIQFARDLYAAITAVDPSRPVSADLSGAGRDYDAIVHPNFATFGHYLSGLGLYTDQVGARTDRPFGQGEFVWPTDQTRQGMIWFATGTAAMRIKDASDIRPYTLLSAWASVIPGIMTSMMRLEPLYPVGTVNPPLFGEDNLPDPWSNAIIMRIQRGFSPVLVADQAYWEANKMSNVNGDWPVAVPALTHNVDVSRTLVIFNDTFSGPAVTVIWEVHADSPTGAIASMGAADVNVPLGSMASQPITIHTPAAGMKCYLVLRAQKNGVTLFEDTAESFTLN